MQAKPLKLRLRKSTLKNSRSHKSEKRARKREKTKGKLQFHKQIEMPKFTQLQKKFSKKNKSKRVSV